MKMHITCINNLGGPGRESQSNTAELAHDLGFREMGLYRYDVNCDSNEMLRCRIDGIIGGVGRDDIVVFQYPSWNGVRYDAALARTLRMYAGKLIIFVHDIDVLLFDYYKTEEDIRNALREQMEILNSADLVILSSPKLHEKLKGYGFKQAMVIYQEVWDFPTPLELQYHALMRRLFFPAGESLSHYKGKTPILQYCRHEWPKQDNVIWKGYVDKNKLLTEMAIGGFGLVYADDRLFERYDSMHQPYKLAGFLAAGIPVIVRKGCVHEKWVEDNGIGYAVSSMEEADSIVQNITEEEYTKLCGNVKHIQQLIITGAYTRKLLLNAVVKVMEPS